MQPPTLHTILVHLAKKALIRDVFNNMRHHELGWMYYTVQVPLELSRLSGHCIKYHPSEIHKGYVESEPKFFVLYSRTHTASFFILATWFFGSLLSGVMVWILCWGLCWNTKGSDERVIWLINCWVKGRCGYFSWLGLEYNVQLFCIEL